MIAARLPAPRRGSRWPTGCGPSRCCGCGPRCPAPSRAWPPRSSASCGCARPDEVDALRRAGQAIDRVHARMAEFLRPGRTEREVGRDIAAAILDEGHATRRLRHRRLRSQRRLPAPRGRRPGHRARRRRWSSTSAARRAEGYCSDCTRMYILGEPPAEFVDYYRVLHDAQLAACAHARPGVTAESVDAAARDVITDGGLRRRVHPPHRARHRRGDARGAVHRRRQRPPARAGHGVLHRAGHLPARPARRPHRGHRGRAPTDGHRAPQHHRPRLRRR